jgi:hypothetical protein
VKQPHCRHCAECSTRRPNCNVVCHPYEDCSDDGDPVIVCKHCPRTVPHVDEDELCRLVDEANAGQAVA